MRNAQAQQVMAQSLVNSARAQQQNASSAMAAQASVRALAAAEAQMAAATARVQQLRAASARETQTSVRALAAAEAKLAAATAAVTAAQKAANFGLATSALNGLKTAASGVLGIFGGPWGLALTAAAVGAYKIKQRSDELKETLERLSQQAVETGDDLEKNASKAARAELTQAQAVLDKANKDLANMNAIFAKAAKISKTYQATMNSLNRNYTPGGTLGLTTTDEKLASRIMDDYKKKVIDVGEAVDRLLEAREKFGDPNSRAWAEARCPDDVLECLRRP